MKAFGLARLGRDAEIRTTSQGESVATLALAFSYGRKGSDGKRPLRIGDARRHGIEGDPGGLHIGGEACIPSGRGHGS